jgi:hypothetical protein
MGPGAPKPAGQQQRAKVSQGGMSTNVGGNLSNSQVGHGNVNNSNNKKTSSGPAVLGILALVVIAALLVKVVPAVWHTLKSDTQDGGLTASSTCQQFLDTDEATEQQAIVDIAMSKNDGGFGSPLALPAIRYSCSAQPRLALGAMIDNYRGQF